MIEFIFGFLIATAICVVAAGMYFDKYIEPYVDYSRMPTFDQEPENPYIFDDPDFKY